MELLLENFKYYNNEDKLIDNHCLLIKDAIIQDISKARPENIPTVDMGGNLITPGFVDLQVNGGSEVFFTNAITEETVLQMAKDHLSRGTTSLLPTLVSTSQENILHALKVVRKCMADPATGILGMHLEGPFINPEKKGAHNSKHIKIPTDEQLKEILEAGRGVLKLLTVAPEILTDQQIEMILSYDVKIFAGHSNSTYETAVASFEKGIIGVTHLYNAMSGLTGRQPGLLGAAFNYGVYAGIIVDGHHCNYAAVRLAHRLVGEKLFLVSDATFIGEKNLEMDGITFIHEPGRYVNANGNLAGSNITMADAVRNAVIKADIPLPKALKMASQVPALTMDNLNIGKLEKGRRADIVALTLDDLKVTAVMRNGKFIK